jgi:hypothetical protein
MDSGFARRLRYDDDTPSTASWGRPRDRTARCRPRLRTGPDLPPQRGRRTGSPDERLARPRVVRPHRVSIVRRRPRRVRVRRRGVRSSEFDDTSGESAPETPPTAGTSPNASTGPSRSRWRVPRRQRGEGVRLRPWYRLHRDRPVRGRRRNRDGARRARRTRRTRLTGTLVSKTAVVSRRLRALRPDSVRNTRHTAITGASRTRSRTVRGRPRRRCESDSDRCAETCRPSLSEPSR